MQRIINFGRYLFPLSFLMYVGLHLGQPETGAAMVPDFLPFPYFWNYATMVCILLFIGSALIGKLDKLAYVLMACYVLLMALLVHLPVAVGMVTPELLMGQNLAATREIEMVNVFRNIMLTGALLGFAGFVARDNRVIG